MALNNPRDALATLGEPENIYNTNRSLVIQAQYVYTHTYTGRSDTIGENVTSAGWQVTLCDPMWHVSARNVVAKLRTAIHLLLTYYTVSVPHQHIVSN